MSTLVEEEVKTDVLESRGHSIVIYNDDINTFDHVIECLVKYCKHTCIQAEQCAHIIHHNGKCAVKDGTFEDLVPIKQAINEKGIDAKIE